MSCRFCQTEQHTVRVVANNAVVTYACGTSFFPTDHELGEPFDSCWSQSKECKAKTPVTENGKRAASLDTYPTAHVEALEARIAALEAEVKQAREDEAWALRHVVYISHGANVWRCVRVNKETREEIEAEAPAIHAALRAIREKVKGGTQ